MIFMNHQFISLAFLTNYLSDITLSSLFQLMETLTTPPTRLQRISLGGDIEEFTHGMTTHPVPNATLQEGLVCQYFGCFVNIYESVYPFDTVSCTFGGEGEQPKWSSNVCICALV